MCIVPVHRRRSQILKQGKLSGSEIKGDCQIVYFLKIANLPKGDTTEFNNLRWKNTLQSVPSIEGYHFPIFLYW